MMHCYATYGRSVMKTEISKPEVSSAGIVITILMEKHSYVMVNLCCGPEKSFLFDFLSI